MMLCSSSRNKPKPAELKYSENWKLKNQKIQIFFLLLLLIFILLLGLSHGQKQYRRVIQDKKYLFS